MSGKDGNAKSTEDAGAQKVTPRSSTPQGDSVDTKCVCCNCNPGHSCCPRTEREELTGFRKLLKDIGVTGFSHFSKKACDGKSSLFGFSRKKQAEQYNPSPVDKQHVSEGTQENLGQNRADFFNSMDRRNFENTLNCGCNRMKQTELNYGRQQQTLRRLGDAEGKPWERESNFVQQQNMNLIKHDISGNTYQSEVSHDRKDTIDNLTHMSTSAPGNVIGMSEPNVSLQQTKVPRVFKHEATLYKSNDKNPFWSEENKSVQVSSLDQNANFADTVRQMSRLNEENGKSFQDYRSTKSQALSYNLGTDSRYREESENRMRSTESQALSYNPVTDSRYREESENRMRSTESQALSYNPVTDLRYREESENQMRSSGNQTESQFGFRSRSVMTEQDGGRGSANNERSRSNYLGPSDASFSQYERRVETPQSGRMYSASLIDMKEPSKSFNREVSDPQSMRTFQFAFGKGSSDTYYQSYESGSPEISRSPDRTSWHQDRSEQISEIEPSVSFKLPRKSLHSQESDKQYYNYVPELVRERQSSGRSRMSEYHVPTNGSLVVEQPLSRLSRDKTVFESLLKEFESKLEDAKRRCEAQACRCEPHPKEIPKDPSNTIRSQSMKDSREIAGVDQVLERLHAECMLRKATNPKDMLLQNESKVLSTIEVCTKKKLCTCDKCCNIHVIDHHYVCASGLGETQVHQKSEDFKIISPAETIPPKPDVINMQSVDKVTPVETRNFQVGPEICAKIVEQERGTPMDKTADGNLRVMLEICTKVSQKERCTSTIETTQRNIQVGPEISFKLPQRERCTSPIETARRNIQVGPEISFKLPQRERCTSTTETAARSIRAIPEMCAKITQYEQCIPISEAAAGNIKAMPEMCAKITQYEQWISMPEKALTKTEEVIETSSRVTQYEEYLPTSKPTLKSTSKSIAKSTSKSTSKTISQTAADSTSKMTSESTIESTSKTMSQSTSESTTESASEESEESPEASPKLVLCECYKKKFEACTTTDRKTELSSRSENKELVKCHSPCECEENHRDVCSCCKCKILKSIEDRLKALEGCGLIKESIKTVEKGKVLEDKVNIKEEKGSRSPSSSFLSSLEEIRSETDTEIVTKVLTCHNMSIFDADEYTLAKKCKCTEHEGCLLKKMQVRGTMEEDVYFVTNVEVFRRLSMLLRNTDFSGTCKNRVGSYLNSSRPMKLHRNWKSMKTAVASFLHTGKFLKRKTSSESSAYISGSNGNTSSEGSFLDDCSRSSRPLQRRSLHIFKSHVQPITLKSHRKHRRKEVTSSKRRNN